MQDTSFGFAATALPLTSERMSAGPIPVADSVLAANCRSLIEEADKQVRECRQALATTLLNEEAEKQRALQLIEENRREEERLRLEARQRALLATAPGL